MINVLFVFDYDKSEFFARAEETRMPVVILEKNCATAINLDFSTVIIIFLTVTVHCARPFLRAIVAAIKLH